MIHWVALEDCQKQDGLGPLTLRHSQEAALTTSLQCAELRGEAGLGVGKPTQSNREPIGAGMTEGLGGQERGNWRDHTEAVCQGGLNVH